MLLDEFLISLGVKADTNSLRDFERGLDDVTDSAEQTEGAMVRAYDATDGFVSEIGKALGIIGFFTATLGGLWGAFHGTIMELEDLIKEEKLLNKVTKDQLEQQKKYKESVETLGKRFQSLKVEMAFGYLPTMQKMIDAVDRFLEANGEMIVNGLMRMVSVMTSVVGAIVNTVRFIDLIIDSTIGWKNALLVLGGIFVWLKRAMLLAFVTNPVMWIIAAIAGLILLIDDFMTYLDGGESEFGAFWGAMIKGIEVAKSAFMSFIEIFSPLKQFIQSFFDFMSALWSGNSEDAINALNGMAESISQIFVNLIGVLGNILPVIWEVIKNVLSVAFDLFVEFAPKVIGVLGAMVRGIANVLITLTDVITRPFRLAIDWIIDKFSQLPSMLGGIVSKLTFGLSDKIGAAVSRTSNRVVNNTSTTTASIQVNGSTSPKATASAISSNLNSITQSNMGGMAKA